MKIRTDFVTNSSSSSFIIITTKENYDKVFEKLHPYLQEIAKACFCKHSTFGKDCRLASYFDSNGCTSLDYLDINYDGEHSYH
jgi:hypothetical protein